MSLISRKVKYAILEEEERRRKGEIPPLQKVGDPLPLAGTKVIPKNVEGSVGEKMVFTFLKKILDTMERRKKTDPRGADKLYKQYTDLKAEYERRFGVTIKVTKRGSEYLVSQYHSSN